MKKLVIAAAAAATLVTSMAVPAVSAPIRPYAIATPDNGIENVQYRRGYYPNRGYYNRGGRYYYNGHRGYNYYRPGYRRYNNWWFPAAAFATGALVGGAIAAAPGPVYRAPPAYAGGGGGHVQWCMSQYRSYRASDNTFQPYNGPRQQCVSPY